MHVFIENTEELLPNKHYITIKNYPIPITVETGIYVKRTSVTIDITDLGFIPDNDGDFEEWAKQNNKALHVHMAVWGYGKTLSQDPKFKQEATNWLAGLRGQKLA